MARAKNERNKQFITAWKKEGLTDRELQERFGLSPGGVKGLKARLRAKDDSLYQEQPKKKTKKPSPGVTSTSTETATSTSTKTKRMAFWLEERMIDKIKVLAAKEKRTSSAILREILGKYLQNK